MGETVEDEQNIAYIRVPIPVNTGMRLSGMVSSLRKGNIPSVVYPLAKGQLPSALSQLSLHNVLKGSAKPGKYLLRSTGKIA